MTETEFIQLAEQAFKRIENQVDASEADIEISLNEGVLVLEFEDRSQVVINRHLPSHELWIAAKSGGFHFAWDNVQHVWFDTRYGVEFFTRLAQVMADQSRVKS